MLALTGVCVPLSNPPKCQQNALQAAGRDTQTRTPTDKKHACRVGGMQVFQRGDRVSHFKKKSRTPTADYRSLVQRRFPLDKGISNSSLLGGRSGHKDGLPKAVTNQRLRSAGLPVVCPRSDSLRMHLIELSSYSQTTGSRLEGALT